MSDLAPPSRKAPQQHVYGAAAALDVALAEYVVTQLGAAIDARGEAWLVVSGGSTPLGFFRQLSQQTLAWQRVSITLADERWVALDHPDSNYALVKRELLQGPAAAARLLPLHRQESDIVAAAAATDAVLAKVGCFDLVILGMGADGHTASLFPQASRLAEGLSPDSGRNCIDLLPPQAPYARLSLTLSRLLDTRQLLVHITGNPKRELLTEAQTIKDVSRLPIAAFLQQTRVPVDVFWAP